jgi:hypothetical protein
MPFLIANLGGEMVYILEQRLQAQNIPKEKSCKVLQDVTKSMFSSRFLSELIKPQEIYLPSATREIYDRLAHSSIMRLSESSMDKLYDLMTMGFKYQIVSCSHPRELIEITLNHLEAIKTAVEASPSALELAENAFSLLYTLCSEISSSEFSQIRQSLAMFFQDKRIKVSLFLQDNIQNGDGSISLQPGGPLYNDETLEAPGTIRYFDENGSLSSSESFKSPLSAHISEKLTGDPFDPKSRDSRLGKNLYTVDRSKKKENAKPPAKTSTIGSTTSSQKAKEVFFILI